MQYWAALDLLKQVAAELGLEQPTTLSDPGNIQTAQLLAFLNSAGNELYTYYPWMQFTEFYDFNTVDGQESYDLPLDWGYFVDQTQWDRTNHWPLMGPKSPQEWAYIKSGLVAAFPRMRYRVFQDQLFLFPTPGSSVFNMHMEYIKCNWMIHETAEGNMVIADGDTVLYQPWMIMKYIKLKFYELKGFDTTGVTSDFMRMFLAFTGKDRGAPTLSLSPTTMEQYIGPWSVPDGNWNTSP